jgi:hypothetical protein
VWSYRKVEESGFYCAPLNLTASGVQGIKDGANATIQIVYTGGDGNLYQAYITSFLWKEELANTITSARMLYSGRMHPPLLMSASTQL